MFFLLGLVVVAAGAEIGARLTIRTSTVSIRWYDASAQLKIEHLDHNLDYDVVFAGTSMAAQDFVPARFTETTGLAAYNAALVGGTPEVMDRWLLEEIVPRANPDMVVWGLSALDLAPAYGATNAAAYDDALATREGLLASWEQRAASFSTLVSERVVLRDAGELWGSAEESRARDLADARAETGELGQRRVFVPDVSDVRGRVMTARLLGFRPDGEDMASIQSTIQLLQESGIEVVLVELPVPERFVELYPAGSPGHESVGAALSAIADLSGVRLIRLVDGYDEADFVDFTHLDESAAERLTAEFAAAFSEGRDDRSTASFADPAGDGSLAADCETETVIDEYGFEIEVCVADEGGDAPVDPATATDPSVGLGIGEGVEDLLDEVLRRVLADCGDDAADDPFEYEIAVAFRDSVDSLLAASRLNRECGEPADAARLEELVTALAPFAADPDAAPAGSEVSLVERLGAGLDDFSAFLEISGARSVFWLGGSELATVVTLEEWRAQGQPVQVVAVGSSQVNWDFDQARFSDHFAGRFLNVGQPGFDAEEWEVLFPRLLGTEDLSTVIWTTSTHRMVNDAGRTTCPSVTSRFDRTQENRTHLGELVGLSSLSTAALVGGGEAVRYRDSALFADWEAQYNGPGDRRVRTETFLGVSDRELRGRYVEPALCRERLELLERFLGALVEDGVEVVLISLPVHESVVALAPDVHAEAARELAAIAGRLELAYSTPDQLTDAESHDGVHANATGRVRVTADVIAFLESEEID